MVLRRLLGFAFVAMACCGAAWAADLAETDRTGRVLSLFAGGEFHRVTTDLAVATPGWKQTHRLDSARNTRDQRRGDSRRWRGVLPAGENASVAFEQELTERDGTVRLTVRMEVRQDVEIAGAYLFVHAPIVLFAGGRVEVLQAEPNQPAAADMPAEQPEKPHLLFSKGKGVRLADGKGTTRLEVALDKPLGLTVQDGRKWKTDRYDAYFQLLGGKLTKGDSAEVTVTLKLSAPADDRPAKLSLDATKKRYRLWGFGGNFCYGVDSPVTRHNLANIRMGYARVGVKLEEWEPTNDNDSPDETDWAHFEKRDKPGSNLRADFLLAQQLARMKVPYISSTWRVPEFVTAQPGRGATARNRILPREKWPEVLECIGSYLLYARRKYGTEPEMFSFNESDIGCFVKMTAEEHRDWNKACGEHFAKLGLKTKMLLADCASAKVEFAEPTVQDPEALKHCAALSFHTWHKGPAYYKAWRDLARRVKRPLICAEVGPDAAAWRTRTYNTMRYFLDELRMYQEILLFAEAQALLEWEYTADYRMLEDETAPDGTEGLRPTPRYGMIRQFANLTPRPAEALETASDHEKVLLTAFADEAGRRMVLHVANLGAAREAAVTGLPAGVGELRAARTTWAAGSEELPPVPARDGRATVRLAAFSLLTLQADIARK